MLPKILGAVIAMILKLDARTFVILSSVIFIAGALVMSVDKTPYRIKVEKRTFALSKLEVMYLFAFLGFFFAKYSTPIIFYSEYGSRAVAAYSFIIPLYLSFGLPKLLDTISSWRRISIVFSLSVIGLFIHWNSSVHYCEHCDFWHTARGPHNIEFTGSPEFRVLVSCDVQRFHTTTEIFHAGDPVIFIWLSVASLILASYVTVRE